MESSLYIPALSVLYTGDGRFVHRRTREDVLRMRGEQGLRIGIRPTADGEDIERIVVSYREGTMVREKILDEESTIGHLASYLLGPWNTENLRGSDFSLLGALSLIFEGLSLEEKERLASTWSDVPDTMTMDSQLVHLWVVGTGSYLGFLALLDFPEIWEKLPFLFTLPSLPTLTHALTKECSQYMMMPIRGIWNASDGLLRALMDTIISFLHTWGSSFQEGIPQDRSRVQIETLSGYSTLVLQNLEGAEDRLLQKADSLYREEEERLATQIQKVATRLEDRLLLKNAECERQIGNSVANARIEFQLVVHGEQALLRTEIQKEKETLQEEARRWHERMTEEIGDLLGDAKKQLQDFITETVASEMKVQTDAALLRIAEAEGRIRRALEPEAEEKKEEKKEDGTARYAFRFHRRR